MVTDQLLIFDHAHQSLTICANVSPGNDPVYAYQNACEKIKETRDLLLNASTLSPAPLQEIDDPAVPLGNFTEKDFKERVNEVKEYVPS